MKTYNKKLVYKRCKVLILLILRKLKSIIITKKFSLCESGVVFKLSVLRFATYTQHFY